MPDLTKIEKPYAFCTKEEQEGLDALIGKEDALQTIDLITGGWFILDVGIKKFYKGMIYRQNPDWQPPKLDVPDWFWENTDYNYVAMDENREVFAYKYKPEKADIDWVSMTMMQRHFIAGLGAVDLSEFTHEFNPHAIPWDQSLTKRPEGKTNA